MFQQLLQDILAESYQAQVVQLDAILQQPHGALQNAEFVPIYLGVRFEVKLDYGDFESFKYYCKINEFNIVELQYLEQICCYIELKKDYKAKLIDDFENRKVKVINYRELEERYIKGSIGELKKE